MDGHPYLIAEIADKTFDPNYVSSDRSHYTVREAARGILIHADKIAFLHVTKENYYKLPGGGIENNESKEEAFKREILEETGYECNVIDYGGTTIEYRDREQQTQISHVFLAEAQRQANLTNFTQDEIDHGFLLEWVSLQDAVNLLTNSEPISWEGQFIQRRDTEIFNYYMK